MYDVDPSALVTIGAVSFLAGAIWRIRHPVAPVARASPARGARASPTRGIGGRIAKGATVAVLRSVARMVGGR